MSQSSTKTSEAEHSSPIPGIFDFSDRLSPMLVNELRQGLKGRVFMIVFLLLHLLLAIILAAAVSEGASDSGASVSTIILWMFAFAVMLVQPLRGLNAISSEIKENTISLVLLTQLSAWKIVVGKWISLVTQSALILLSLLPYVFLRYFLGGMDLLQELTLYACVFILGAGLCAFCVGVSSLSSLIVRGFVGLVGLFIFSSVILNRVIFGVIGWFSNDPTLIVTSLITVIGLSGYVSWLALDIGASVIAPISENRSTKRRLMSLGFLFITVGSLLLLGYFEAAFFSCLVIITPMIFFLLNEPYELVPTICVPFLKRGLLGRLAARLLYPGWQTGVWFLMLPVGVFFCLLYSSNTMFGSSLDYKDIFHFQVCMSCVLFPAVISLGFFERLRPHLGFYLIAAAFMGLMTTICIIVAENVENTWFLHILSIIPPVQIANFEYNLDVHYNFGDKDRYYSAMIASSYILAFHWIVLLIISCLRRKRTVLAEKEALKILKGGATK